MNTSVAEAIPTRKITGLASDDLFDLRYVRAAHLSPDGRHVAYVVSATEDDREFFQIHLAGLDGGYHRVLPFPGSATSPRWSPDGRWLAFVGDGRLHVACTSSWTTAAPLTEEELTVQGLPSWSPDSAQLAISVLQLPAPKSTRRITTRHFRAEGIGFTEDLTQRIAIVQRAGGALRFVTDPEQGFCSQPDWSPCGRRILFLSSDSAVPFSSYSPRLIAVDVETARPQQLLDDRWYLTAARWLPCGERVAVAAVRDSMLTAPNPLLWVLRLQDGAMDLRTPGMTAKISGLIHHDMPAWELMQGNPLLIQDENTALVTVLNRGSLEIWRVGLRGDPAVRPILNGERSCVGIDVCARTSKLLYAVTSLHSPTELWCAALDGREEKPLTALNTHVLARWPKMRVEQFVCTSADGLKFDAWFMVAAHQRLPVPTILFIHGGPFAATGHAFRYDFHLLASNGFGVVFANFRGSAGYGDGFSRAIMGDWGGRGFPDHMATVDTAIELGLAQADRLGVWGASHGGFATCWIVGHTSRFKAAVAEAASTNFTTAYYLKDGPEVIARDLGGRPHEIPDVYRACSPITYAHRCTTPTLFVHGEDDLRCPISEAEQFFRVLQDVGCVTEMVRIPQCHHLGDSCGPLSARRAQNEALLGWFQRHL
jgi:dipeptidyl aminopeptidase/acylaminoacyl peptidase